MKCTDSIAADGEKRAVQPEITSGETIDELDCHKIIQKRNGYRFSADSVCLADFVLPLKPEDAVIDLGTGSGVIPLMLAQKSPVRNIVGIEIQQEMAEIARRNVALNNLSSIIKIVKADFRSLSFPSASSLNERRWRGSFSVVLSNPPYTKFNSGRISPSREKAIAKMEFACSLDDLIMASKHLVAEEGRICFVYPAARLQEMLTVVKRYELEVVRLKFICPRQGINAKRFLIEIMKRNS